MVIPITLRIAAVFVWISGIGLGIPCIMAIRNLASGRDLPLVFGFTAYGGGAFERRGLNTSIPLLLSFLLVSLIELPAGWLLWEGSRLGGVLSLGLLVPGAVYWWGFDLPYPPMAAIVRVILILLSWSALR
jgi:hypothetical protein